MSSFGCCASVSPVSSPPLKRWGWIGGIDLRGEHNKKWNKRVTRPCPVCGGRVIVAHRNQSWWIRCDDDPFHIKYKPYEDPYSAIRAFNAQTNADRIRSMSDEELAIEETSKGGCPHDCETPDDMDTDCVRCWLEWLKQEVDNG